ncbi:unnamed protein product [Heterobilharzia americana]|nr:unnamed protein product [Heterobilharzia americana]
MGFSTDGSSYLHPEEALFLTECNKLQITYENLPLSIQQLYDQLLNNETYLHYIVYCRLSRLNFSLRKREIFYSFPIYHNPTERLFKIPKSISIPLGIQPVFDIEVINKTKIKDFQPLINTNKIHSLASLMNSLQKIVMVTNADSIGSKGDLNLVYDMYGNNHTEKERINNFSKRFPAHPDYVISIASPEQVCPDVEAQKLINVGLEPNTSIILCMVDGCDVSFYTMNHFEIPNLSFEITHHSNTQSL